MLKIAKEFMDITHKVDLPDQVVSRLQKGLNFLDIPPGKVPELAGRRNRADEGGNHTAQNAAMADADCCGGVSAVAVFIGW
jgi:hypothetical protein